MDSQSESRNYGPRVLALTGFTLVTLTVAGAVLRYAIEDALWTQVWFAVSIGGLVGFSTNWIAIKMLFHPRVRVLGVQGVVPSRRLELARSVGETLEEHLISGDRMHRLLVDSGAVDEAIDNLAIHLPTLLRHPDTREIITRQVTHTIQDTMGDVILEARGTLKRKARSNFSAFLGGGAATASLGPMAGVIAAGAIKSGMLDKIVDRMIDNMAEELRRDGGVDGAARGIVDSLPQRAEDVLSDRGLRDRLNEVFGDMAGDLINGIDVAGLIEQELLARDEGELEELIDRVAANELTFIQVAGGGLGMVAGLALVWPWLLLPVGGAFLVMVQIARRAERRYIKRREAEEFAHRVLEESEPPHPGLPSPENSGNIVTTEVQQEGTT